MPTYAYHCRECGHEFEEFLTMSKSKEPESNPCPSCGKSGVIEQSVSVPEAVAIEAPKKISNGFKEVLQKVAQHHPRHSMNMR